jgi:hypothetical protein
MRILPHSPEQVIEQDLIEAGLNMFRSDDRRAGFAGEFNSAIHEQRLDQLAGAERQVARPAVYHDGIIDG